MSLLFLTLEVALLSTLTSLSLVSGDQDHSFLAVGPAMIAAVGTVAAFSVTFALFLRGASDRIRQQATSVYATRSEAEKGVVTATIHNASQLPIWHVEARPLRARHLFEDGVPQPKPDLAPGETATFTWRGSGALDRDWRIRFIDSADRTWVRIGNRLVREGAFLRRNWR